MMDKWRPARPVALRAIAVRVAVESSRTAARNQREAARTDMPMASYVSI